MRRIIFNTAAILSLVLCLVFIYSCLRSLLPTHVHLGSVDGALVILCWEGASFDLHTEEFNPKSEKFAGIRTIMSNMSHDSDHQFLGFRSLRGSGIFRGVPYQIYFIPYWFLIPLTAILPILWFRHGRRQRLRAHGGQCLKCGYDLRESKGQCPECGATVPENKGVTAV